MGTPRSAKAVDNAHRSPQRTLYESLNHMPSVDGSSLPKADVTQITGTMHHASLFIPDTRRTRKKRRLQILKAGGASNAFMLSWTYGKDPKASVPISAGTIVRWDNVEHSIIVKKGKVFHKFIFNELARYSDFAKYLPKETCASQPDEEEYMGEGLADYDTDKDSDQPL